MMIDAINMHQRIVLYLVCLPACLALGLSGCGTVRIPATESVTYQNHPVPYGSYPMLIGCVGGAYTDSLCEQVLAKYDLTDVTSRYVEEQHCAPCLILKKRDGSPFDALNDETLRRIRREPRWGGTPGPLMIIRGREIESGFLRVFQPVLDVTFKGRIDRDVRQRIIAEFNPEKFEQRSFTTSLPESEDPEAYGSGHANYRVWFDAGVGEGINALAADLYDRPEVARVVVVTASGGTGSGKN